MHDKAEELFGAATAVLLKEGTAPHQRSEAALWVDQWLAAARRLAHWDVLLEYAARTDNASLAAEAQWHLPTPDWAGLKDNLAHRAQLEDTPATLLLRAHVALSEADYVTADSRVQAAMTAAITRWWMLPEVGTTPQAALLAQFQSLVEAKESARVLLELAAGQQRGDVHYGDLKDTLETWRLRVPNDWEAMTHWQDVLMWRNAIYSIVIAAFDAYREVKCAFTR